jgi:hypothetical protein
VRRYVTSLDGTKIAYEALGVGPAVIIVLGALNARKSGATTAKLLAPTFHRRDVRPSGTRRQRRFRAICA